jgi:hypothetical protein
VSVAQVVTSLFNSHRFVIYRRASETRYAPCNRVLPTFGGLGKNATRTSSDVGRGIRLNKMENCSVPARRLPPLRETETAGVPGMLKKSYPVCIQCCREDHQRRRPAKRRPMWKHPEKL